MASGKKLEAARLSSGLAERIEAGEEIAGVLNSIREQLAEMQIADTTFTTKVINRAGWRLYSNGNESAADELISSLHTAQWNESTEKLRKVLDGEEVPDVNLIRNPDNIDTPMKKGFRLIREGHIQQGVKLVKTATGEHSNSYVSVGNHLLQHGYPHQAVEVIEPVLALGIARNSSNGLDMGAINLLAKCARADSSLERKFVRQVEQLRISDELPDEYCERAYFLFETGKVFDPSRYRRSARKHGIDNHFEVKESTQDTIAKTPLIGAQVVGGLPELDDTGEAKKQFNALIDAGQIPQAYSLLLEHRNTVEGRVYLLYERRISSALVATADSIEDYEEIISLSPFNDSFLILAINNLLNPRDLQKVLGLFWRHGRENLRVARVFGQKLFQTGRRNNSLVPTAATALLETGHPKTALEILKPTLLDYISNNRPMPLKVIRVFAQCAAIDTEIRNELLEQLQDYKRHRLLQQKEIDEVLQLTYANDNAGLADARNAVNINGQDESDEAYIGRVARSKFFQEPHEMLRADPVDRTAVRVTRTPRRLE